MLSEALEANECLTGPQALLAMRLMGKCPEMFPGDGELAAFRMFVVATQPDIDADEVANFLCIDMSQLEPEARDAAINAKLPTREAALEGLWATLDAELERLGPIVEQLWDCEDGPALSEKMALAAFDNSKNGVLRRRYESANHMDMHRCLKQFTEQRRQSVLRDDDEFDLEEREADEREAAIRKKYHMEKAQRARLRNEPNRSAATEGHVSTSGKSAGVVPRDFSDPSKYIKKVAEERAAASEAPPTSNPAAPGASEAPKPS
jgi:hypothetical protein